MPAIIVIPSYDGDGVTRVGQLYKFTKSKTGSPFVVLEIGHDGHCTKKLYRAYKLCKCECGVFHIDEESGKLAVGIPVT